MKIGFIVLCRYNSTRLPGKILKQINGRYVIDYIIGRLCQVVPRENIVIATSDLPTDQPIAEYCAKAGINCYRGNLENVAGRFLACARAQAFDFAFRINGDNIFIDTDLVQEAVDLARTNKYRFISNVHQRSYPKGMSIEGVDVELFAERLPFFTDYHREHVMPYLYEHADEYTHHYIYNTSVPELAGIQLAIDTQDDLDLAQKIMDQLPGRDNFGLKEISTALKKIYE